jgi:hypothetical protein
VVESVILRQRVGEGWQAFPRRLQLDLCQRRFQFSPLHPPEVSFRVEAPFPLTILPVTLTEEFLHLNCSIRNLSGSLGINKTQPWNEKRPGSLPLRRDCVLTAGERTDELQERKEWGTRDFTDNTDGTDPGKFLNAEAQRKGLVKTERPIVLQIG